MGGMWYLRGVWSSISGKGITIDPVFQTLGVIFDFPPCPSFLPSNPSASALIIPLIYFKSAPPSVSLLPSPSFLTWLAATIMATSLSVFSSLLPFPKVCFLPVFSFNLFFFFFSTHGYDLLQPDLICSQLEPWLETLATHLPTLPPPAAISPQDIFFHTGSASCCFFLTWQTQLLSLDL